MWAAFAQAGGLQATYYVATNIEAPFGAIGANRVVQVDQTVDFSVTSSTTRAGISLDVKWSARWTGMVRPSLSETYTFHAGGDVTNENIGVGKLCPIPQNLDPDTMLSGILFITRRYVRVMADYITTSGCSFLSCSRCFLSLSLSSLAAFVSPLCPFSRLCWFATAAFSFRDLFKLTPLLYPPFRLFTAPKILACGWLALNWHT